MMNFTLNRFLFGLIILASGNALLAEPPATFPQELVRFRAYAENPVFKPGKAGEWDEAIRERGWILKENGKYHLWYTGYDGTREGQKMLGYASSADGIRWERHTENPIDREHWVEDMMVVHHEGAYYMFAEGQGDQAQLLRSADGVRWTRIGPLDVRKTDGRPIEPGPSGTPTAYFENGTWHLFYERGDKGVWLATSKDMKIWTNIKDQPVLSLGPGDNDSRMIALNQIIKHQGRYYAYYHGSGDAENPRLWAPGIAASPDLIRWTKYENNPLRSPQENRSSGIVVPEGDQFRFYTMHGKVDLFLPAGEN